MNDPSLIADLVRAGVDPELVGRVANAIAAANVQAPVGRSKHAEAQARYLENKKARDADQRDHMIISDHNDRVHILTSLPSSEKKVKKERKVSISMPSDWQPTPTNIEYATSKGWTIEYAHSEATRFRDHGLSTGKKYRDIDAAWRNWVTSPYQRPNARGSPGGAPPRPGSREDRAERTYHALQKLSAFANGSHADEQRASSKPREATFGLLPFPKPS